MVLWNDVDVQTIEYVQSGRDRTKFRYQGGPLRFQIPKGTCQWGVSQFKSMIIEFKDQGFAKWWSDLETLLCPQEPFRSNMGPGPSLRLKIDEAAYIFDENSKQVSPDVREGLFRGQEVTCMVDIDSTYFFNGNWGLVVRVYQLKTWGPCAETPAEPSSDGPVLAKGTCAFLPVTD